MEKHIESLHKGKKSQSYSLISPVGAVEGLQFQVKYRQASKLPELVEQEGEERLREMEKEQKEKVAKIS